MIYVCKFLIFFLVRKVELLSLWYLSGYFNLIMFVYGVSKDFFCFVILKSVEVFEDEVEFCFVI